MASWAVVDRRGEVVGQFTQVAPARDYPLPEGRRLSCLEYVDLPGLDYHGPGFSMSHGSAQGEVVLTSTRGGPCFRLEVDGPDVAEVLRLRDQILQELGIREIHNFPPAIAHLKSFWDRLRWLITGKLPQ